MLQFLRKDNIHRILLLFVCLAVVLSGIMAYAVPPGVDPDSAWGFMVMHCMEQGHHFNLLISPNPANISTNQSEFLSWWSPGQYLLPYFFSSLLKVNTGQAVAITVTACYLTGLTGFYMFFKQLDFTKWISALSVAFIATQQFFIEQFVYYNGGEVLLFAFMGWFLYGCFYFKKITWQTLIFVFLAGLSGFFSKSSFLWMYAAGAACLWINVSVNETRNSLLLQPDDEPKKISRPKKKQIWLRNGLLVAAPVIFALSIIYFFYLSKGVNPTSGAGKLLITPEAFSFPLASPMISAFSIDEIIDGLIYQPDGPAISYQTATIILVGLAICSLIYATTIARLSPDKKYTLAFLVFYILGTIFFAIMFLKQATISYEGRHFRIIGLLAIPGIIYLLFKTKISKVFFFIIWIVFICTGFSYFQDEYEVNKSAGRGATGLSQQLYDDTTLNEITRLDREHRHDAIFVVMSADIGSEIVNNRVITISVDDMTKQYLLESKYSGNSGPIFILMPAEYLTDGKNIVIAKSFVNYHNFKVKQLSKDYYLYSAIN